MELSPKLSLTRQLSASTINSVSLLNRSELRPSTPIGNRDFGWLYIHDIDEFVARFLESKRFRLSRARFSLKEKEEDEEWEIKQSGVSSLFVVRSARRVDNQKERVKVSPP